MGNISNGYKELGFEDFYGLICKLRENISANCSSKLDNYTMKCRSTKGHGCIKNITRHVGRSNFISFKVKNMKDVTDPVKLEDLGVCCEYVEVQISTHFAHCTFFILKISQDAHRFCVL
jgi:hypothetical protein